MQTPLVSIIIPTYKREWSYLGRAVRSVLEQTYKEIECIVVDDSPADYPLREENIANVRAAAGADPRLKLLVNETNMGGSLARNRGLDSARGEFVSFLDDDDEYCPEKIEHQVAFMLEQGCDLSLENMTMYSASGAVVDVREYRDIESFDNGYLLRYHLMKHLTGTPTFMFRAEALRRIGGFDDARMGQEFYLMLKSIESGLKIAYYPVFDVKIYKHADGGISQGRNKIDGENALYGFKKRYFPRLERRERMFIRFRHYAVMVVAYMRNRRPFSAAGAAVCAFASSPLDFVREVFGFAARIARRKDRSRA